MAQKSATNRKSPVKRKRPKENLESEMDETDQFDQDGENHGYMAQTASQVADYTREHQGRVVLTALLTGFSIGLFLGGLLAHGKKEETWSDRLTAEGLGRRLMHRVDQILPHAIAEKIGRG